MATDYRQRSPGEVNGHSQNGGDLRTEAREIGREFAGISSDVQRLAQLEMQLARAEISEQASAGTGAAAWAGGAAVFAMLTLAFLLVTLMFGLAEFMDLWIAALITTGVAALLMGLAGMLAYQRFKQVTLTPKRTIRSVQEDYRWLRSQMKSNAR